MNPQRKKGHVSLAIRQSGLPWKAKGDLMECLCTLGPNAAWNRLQVAKFRAGQYVVRPGDLPAPCSACQKPGSNLSLGSQVAGERTTGVQSSRWAGRRGSSEVPRRPIIIATP